MTHRRDLVRHRHTLSEIREIMNSMKTLAYMETRKLARFLDAQHAVVQSIEDVAMDLLSFYPETLPEAKETTSVYLMIGSERGFCGDFNHALSRHLESSLQRHSSNVPLLITVGHKLATLLEEDTRVVARIDGASVVEEATILLSQVVSELTTLQKEHGVLTVFCLYHSSNNGVVTQKLLPPFQDFQNRPPRFLLPPILHQTPQDLIVTLTDHYLFAALHEMFYTSLMEENHHRVAHLDGAVKHLDTESEELTRRCNALRQEEIIEEIEVILLSATSLDDKPDIHGYANMQDNK